MSYYFFKQGFAKLGKESGKIARDILVDIASCE